MVVIILLFVILYCLWFQTLFRLVTLVFARRKLLLALGEGMEVRFHMLFTICLGKVKNLDKDNFARFRIEKISMQRSGRRW